MLRLYKKSELAFAIVCIVVYCVLQSVGMDLSRNLGVAYSGQAILNVAFSLVLLAFTQRNGLLGRYGLCRAKAPAARFLWYLPLILLSTQGLWPGVGINYPALDAACRLVCMLCVGFLEELIFRGFLFRGIARDNVREAIIISSVTFGLGHIVNLVNGSGMGLVENLCQVAYAIAIGYLFVTIFYRGGTIVPCILSHAAINMSSTFANQAISSAALIAGSIGIIVISLVYAAALRHTLPAADDSEYSGK